MKIVTAFLLILFLLPGMANAQLSSGSILGIVSDSTGAVIPGVSVKATGTATGLVRETLTNESGNYRIDLLPPGEYQVEAELAGFRKEVRRGITINIDQRARIDFALSVGEVSQVVNVEGQAPAIQTEDSNVGQVVDERKIVELPLNGREFSQLSYIVPGAYAPKPLSNLGYRGGFSILGALEATNQYILDGVANNGTGTTEIGARPNVDAVAEFKVQTANYSAQYGRYAGGQVDTITKSGTNEVHGSTFFFDRNSAFGARNFFDPYPESKLPAFRRGQFGGVIGGPIVRNKAFFFAGYQGQRQIAVATFAPTVPLPEFFQGNLSRLPSAVKDPLTGKPFPGNIIPQNRLSSIALGLQRFWPVANGASLINNSTSHLDQPDNYNQLNSKVDYQITSSQRLSGAFTYYNENLLEPLGAPQIAGFQTKGLVVSQAMSLSHVWTLSPTVVNESRIGYSRVRRGRYIEDATNQDWPDMLGIPGTQAASGDKVFWGVPVVNISGYAGIGTPYPDPQPRTDSNFNLIDNVSFQHGNHAVKIGVDFLRAMIAQLFTTDGRGNFTFTGSRTGAAFGDFLLGLPGVDSRSLFLGPYEVYPHRNLVDAFVQDDWKLTQHLTLNIGLRYEGNFAITEKYGRLGSFDPTLGNGRGGLRVQAITPRYSQAIAKFQSLNPGVEVRPAGKITDNALKNFAPRFGFAYSPSDQKTAIRGGYGVFFQIPMSPGPLCYCGILNNAPFVLAQRFTSANGITFSNPWGTGTGVNLSPNALDPHERATYYQEWNFGIQHQLPSQFVIDIAYQGKKGTHIQRSRDINEPFDRTTGIRPFAGYNAMYYEETTGASTYNGLHIRTERRSANGLSYLASYAWGKLIDDLGTPQDSYNQRANRGLADEDLRHRATVSVVYELPLGKDKKFLSNASPWAQQILGGWEVSGIMRANTGYPQTAALSINNSGTGDNTDRPNAVANPALSKGTPLAWYNKAAFVMPPKGQFGNAGRNTLTGPGTWNQDIAFMKLLTPAESQQIQIRAELFNAFNHTNLLFPVTTWNSGAFGSISGAQPSRQVQFGLKWLF